MATIDEFIQGLLQAALLICIPAVTALLIYNYVHELWIFVTDRGNYNTLKKPRMADGDDNGKEITSAAGRLLFTYPLFIGGFGFCTYFLVHGV